jgi:hypothetical protein
MTLVAALARVQQIESMLAPPPAATPVATSATTTADLASADGVTFAGALQGAMGSSNTAAAASVRAPGTSAGQAIVAAARGEVGQAEQPPGSNDSPRIAMYRQATAGSGVGPWCAYFASWAARQAGVPLGDHGQGFGAVSDVWAWAQSSGKALPAGSRPAAGDLIVWGSRHIGIVESVDPNGTIHTIEGNSSDRVSRRTYGPDGGGATGYVHLG